MPLPTSDTVVNHLELLPLELLEPILAKLSFRDVISLAKYAPENSRIAIALEISPTWKGIWPTYLAHKADFEVLASLQVPIGGGRLFDPTRGALDVTPAQFHRLVEAKRARHGEGYDFFRYTAHATSVYLVELLTKDDTLFYYLCDQFPVDNMAIIAPWLKPEVEHARNLLSNPVGSLEWSQGNMALVDLRKRFFESLKTDCQCFRWNLRWRAHPLNPGKDSCLIKHPDRPGPELDTTQIKALVDAYSQAQKWLNETKATQLRELAGLYTNHPYRLKEPLAPQVQRANLEHVPRQLRTTAKSVERLIDFDRRLQRRINRGTCRFRNPHACLIPYDWCLHLWAAAAKIDPAVFCSTDVADAAVSREPPATAASTQFSDSIDISTLQIRDANPTEASTMVEDGQPQRPIPPTEILHQIDIVNRGYRVFYLGDEETDWFQSDACELLAGIPRLSGCGYEIVPPRPLCSSLGEFLLQQEQLFSEDPSCSSVPFSFNPERYSERAVEWARKKRLLQPVKEEEMEWLTAFSSVAKWMEEAYPELAAQAKEDGEYVEYMTEEDDALEREAEVETVRGKASSPLGG